MKDLLVQLEAELTWPKVKKQDKLVAEHLYRLAPLFVETALKLSRTRAIQAQSTAKRKTGVTK